MDYLKKIETFKFEVTRTYSSSDEVNIRSLEDQLGINLPDTYKAFIRNFGTLYITSPVMFKSAKSIPNVTIEDDLGKLGGFFNWGTGPFSIHEAIRMRSDQIPKQYIPFAEGSLGDYIGFMFAGKNEYRVAYFYHEGPIGGTIHEIALDFEQFILSLREHEIKITDEQKENLNKSYRIDSFSPQMIERLKKAGKWKGD